MGPGKPNKLILLHEKGICLLPVIFSLTLLSGPGRFFTTLVAQVLQVRVQVIRADRAVKTAIKANHGAAFAEGGKKPGSRPNKHNPGRSREPQLSHVGP